MFQSLHLSQCINHHPLGSPPLTSHIIQSHLLLSHILQPISQLSHQQPFTLSHSSSQPRAHPHHHFSSPLAQHRQGNTQSTTSFVGPPNLHNTTWGLFLNLTFPFLGRFNGFNPFLVGTEPRDGVPGPFLFPP